MRGGCVPMKYWDLFVALVFLLPTRAELSTSLVPTGEINIVAPRH